MPEDNVVQIPSRLERLANQIKNTLVQCEQGLEKAEAGRKDWVEAAHALCLLLVEARQHHPADIGFGEWCAANGFGEDVLNHQTRAAAIKMGKEPEALRSCLEATQRWSLRHIYRLEFTRFTHAGKPCDPIPAQRKPKMSHTVGGAIRARCTDGEWRTAKKVAELVGHREPEVATALKYMFQRGNGNSTFKVEKRLTQQEGQEYCIVSKAAAQQAEVITPLPLAEMPPTLEQRYEAAVRAAEKRLRNEIIAEISTEYKSYVKEYSERIRWAEQVLDNFKGLMSRAHFRKIKACLHPDHNTFVFAAEALQVFSELEKVLVKPEPRVIAGLPPLPETVGELLARRAELDRQRAAERRQRTAQKTKDQGRTMS
jgi:hypothetical protein